MWETMNLNPPLFVLSTSGFQSFPGLKIQTWATRQVDFSQMIRRLKV
jgi:hypothetical protein